MDIPTTSVIKLKNKTSCISLAKADSVPASSGIMTVPSKDSTIALTSTLTVVTKAFEPTSIDVVSAEKTASVPACAGIKTVPSIASTITEASVPTVEVVPNEKTATVPASAGIKTVLTIGPAAYDWDLDSVPDISSFATTAKPAQPVLKPALLKDRFFHFQHGGTEMFFVDKTLPDTATTLVPDKRFDASYFVTLSMLCSAEGPSYSPGTPNYRGARMKLAHTTLNMERWRHHLVGYDKIEICQFLEYGFPIGLGDPSPILTPAMSNHGSSYSFYPWIDKFLVSSLKKKYVAGPFLVQPFQVIHLSPLMTAEKKPDGRRPVFDATFGDHSLNNGTPPGYYLGQEIDFAYPRFEDFRRLVILCGKGSYMWKRDLSSFFLQIPMDPSDYPKLCFIWRSMLFFFIGTMFGLRHAGFNAQRVTDAVTWIHQRLGLGTSAEKLYNSINYSDDIGGCESGEDRATQSSEALANLLAELGLLESSDKYHPPSTSMPYLGVQFDSVKLRMSVPPEKLSEVSEEVGRWVKKTTLTKKTLQQLLGKLFWVSRCVRFSRPFMGRLLQQLRLIHPMPDNKKITMISECRMDLLWWNRFLRRFNGVELMYVDEPMDLSLTQLLDTSALVNCGDAQVWGGGAYFGQEYWSRPFPPWLQSSEIGIHLKEFYVLLVSCWLWSGSWHGCVVYLFCDNDAVVESLDKEKPKDPKMQDLLREFLYIVCTRKFTQIFRKIGTKENFVADFISRCHDSVLTTKFFAKNNLPARKLISVPDNLFNLSSNW